MPNRSKLPKICKEFDNQPMTSGKQVRMGRLFGPDGKTLIAALDHGIAGVSPLASLEKPEKLIGALTKAGVDAFILTPGLAEEFASLIHGKGLVLRVDCGPTALTGNWLESHPVVTVEDALRLGADAIIAMGIVGTAGESRSLQALAQLARGCEGWSMPLIAEMLPGGFAASECPAEQIKIAARLGAELGADIIKIRYSGSGESFCAVTETCFRPVVVLGGSAQDPSQLAVATREAMAAGARGAAVGRNIWQANDPAKVASLLAEAVHG
jgi:DhnA family fructose-bisphosphate aldolase class Ia